MRTYFGLIDDYGEGDAVVRELQERGFAPDQINVIIHENIAKNSMEAGFNSKKADKSENLGQPGTPGLDGMIGGQQAITIPDVGRVYAAGEQANMLIGMAAIPGTPDAGLKKALIDFNLPREAAEFFQEGVRDGGLLFFIRANDERASEAANILRAHKAQQVTTAAG